MKVSISIKKIKDGSLPDATPWCWRVKHRGGSTSSCTDSEQNAIVAAVDAAQSELLWWARHRTLVGDFCPVGTARLSEREK